MILISLSSYIEKVFNEAKNRYNVASEFEKFISQLELILD